MSQMRNKDPKNTVRQIETLVGRKEALRLMVIEGVSPSTADKLLAERYDSEVGALLSLAIARAMDAAKNRGKAS